MLSETIQSVGIQSIKTVQSFVNLFRTFKNYYELEESFQNFVQLF